jgi:Fe2+ or Zn2+ uptake regulation protein
MATRTADRMLGQLRDAGFKITAQRVAIVTELADDPSHPTAQELYERLRPNEAAMSFATVYNTLSALEQVHACTALALSQGPTRFDPKMDPHHHLICDQCGNTVDLPYSESPEVAALPEGFALRSIEKIYRGVCAPCRT